VRVAAAAAAAVDDDDLPGILLQAPDREEKDAAPHPIPLPAAPCHFVDHLGRKEDRKIWETTLEGGSGMEGER